MTFVKFQPTMGIRPWFALSRSSGGSLRANASAVRELFDGVGYVVLYYESAPRRFGIRKALQNEEGALRLVRHAAGGASMFIGRFLRRLEFGPVTYARYAPKEMDGPDGPMFVIDVDNPLPMTHSPFSPMGCSQRWHKSNKGGIK